jgi:hypothetical protein
MKTSETKPKPPAPATRTRLAAEALVETIDGPVRIVELVGKAIPVLTRFRDGNLGFRMLREVRAVEPAAPLLEVTNQDGQIVAVGLEHVFVRSDGSEVRAGDLEIGEKLEPGWSYPSGYGIPAAPEYGSPVRGRPWQQAVVVTATRPLGEGALYGFSVNETKTYFLTFGARCRAQV